MKRIISIALVFAILICTGCSKKTTTEETKQSVKIGITMYNEFDAFTEEILKNIENDLAEYAKNNDVEISTTVVYSGENQLVQNDQVDDFIDKDYDVVCVNLVDRTDPSVIIERAKNTSTPIIFFNRELVKDDLKRYDKLYYVGADPAQSGQLQGELVLEALNDPEIFEKIDFNHDGVIQYVLLEGEAGHQDAIVRSRVSVNTIKNNGYEMEILGDEIANWDRQQAKTKMNSLLEGHPWQIELILANDDNMALGAIDALESYGVKEMPLIVGVNGQQEALEAINDKKMYGTVLNNAEEKGSIIASMAAGLALNGSVPDDIELSDGKYIYVDYEPINQDTVLQYLE